MPAEWAVDSLRTALLSSPTYGINAAAVPYDENLPTYIRITDIDEEGRFRPSPRVSVAHAEASRFYLGQDDLVFARTGASVGKSYLYDERDGPLVYAGFLIRVTPEPRQLLPAFLAYYAQSRRYWDWVASSSVRSGQPGINAQQYGKLQLPLPPLGEQRAIAGALSDVDELLRTLDALIAKKQAIKQAAMQQLLTGRTRLPGFTEPWSTKRLGEVLKICHGRSQRQVEVPDGPYPILATGGQIGNASQALHDRPSVLIGRKGTIDRPQYMDTPFWTVDTLFYSAMADSNDAKFFYYRFWLIDWMRFNEASGVPSLSAKTIERIELSCPGPTEQSAIATVLSELEAEVNAIQARRDKTHLIKLGMMQQLLTGRIRLGKPTPTTEAPA